MIVTMCFDSAINIRNQNKHRFVNLLIAPNVAGNQMQGSSVLES